MWTKLQPPSGLLGRVQMPFGHRPPHFVRLWPKESPRALRGCMVLQTNCIFDALCVFDAISATCCLIAYSELLTIIYINRLSIYENTIQLHGTRHFVNILSYISDFQISFQSTTNLRGKQETASALIAEVSKQSHQLRYQRPHASQMDRAICDSTG